MRILIYSSSSLYNPQFGIQMNEAINFSKKGCEVAFCYCNYCLSICSENVYGKKAMCTLCHSTYSNSLKKLISHSISIYPLTASNKHTAIDYPLETLDDIKKCKYKEVEIGYAVLSFYITKTRNPNPIVDAKFKECVSRLLIQAMNLADSIEGAIRKIKPDKIVFFNGRFFETKPLYDLSIRENIPFICTENIGGIRTDEKYKIVHFDNTLPHDLSMSFQRCLMSWEKSELSEEDKIQIGSSFYEKRRNGIVAGDKVYTLNQIRNFLPTSIDRNKKNIVIFCSSEDEMASISFKYEKYKLFATQYDGIKYLLESMLDDDRYHFILRIHPHLAGTKFDYHTNLYKLNSFNNITIIAPTDPTSSYALLDIADTVVVFESTIGAEAVYWGKPVVVLSAAAYYDFNMCSVPQTKEEIIDCIYYPRQFENAKLLAIKYGYYLLNNSLAEEPMFINITPNKMHICKWNYYAFDYLNFLHSYIVYRLIYSIFHRFISLFCKSSILYPDKIIQ